MDGPDEIDTDFDLSPTRFQLLDGSKASVLNVQFD